MIATRSDICTWTKTDDGAIVVLDLRSSRYLSLNGAGALLWEQLSDGTTSAELVDGLVDRFQIDRDRAVKDVDAFLADLGSRELLTDHR